jgi:hypothetical protein
MNYTLYFKLSLSALEIFQNCSNLYFIEEVFHLILKYKELIINYNNKVVTEYYGRHACGNGMRNLPRADLTMIFNN